MRQSGDLSSDFRIVTVPTKVDHSHEEGWELINALVDLDAPVAPPLSYDIEFVRSFTKGAVIDANTNRSKAFDEVSSLTEFLLRPSKTRASARRASPLIASMAA